MKINIFHIAFAWLVIYVGGLMLMAFWVSH